MRHRQALLLIMILGLGGCAESLPFYISLESPSESHSLSEQRREPGGPGNAPAERAAKAKSQCVRVGGSTNSNDHPCTLYFGEVVQKVVTNQDDIGRDDTDFSFDIRKEDAEQNSWDLRKLQTKLERQVQREIDRMDLHVKKPFTKISKRSSKWLAAYSLDSTDPDQDIERLQEYVRSMAHLKHVLSVQSLQPDPDPKNIEIDECPFAGSLWCGSPNSPTSLECADKNNRLSLYKITSSLNTRYLAAHRENLQLEDPNTETAIDQVLMQRIATVAGAGDRYTRFLVLGYQIPWDADETSVRYGVIFLFEEKRDAPETPSSRPGLERRREFIGHTLFYANEATPEPRIAPGSTPKDPPLGWRNVVYATGYPIAAIIGIKNAVFEVAKVPFSLIGGLVAGRDEFWRYPVQNFKSAWHILEVETTTRPRYGFLTGLLRLVGETPLVGQIFHVNTGPAHPDFDKAVSNEKAKRKIFLSRGIYGGDKWGQDTGLWAAWMRYAYPDYDLYSPAYRHGTVTDVVWSMFNLSHGPAYNEARYVMQKAGRFDHVYLAGQSGGVQRSAAASRILSNHGYSVMKVVGIAGPSIGQAYVDGRYPNAFQIFLNTDPGANQDIVSKIGAVAYTYSTVLDWVVLGVPKYLIGGAVGIVNDRYRESWYRIIDHMGFSNAVTTQITRKISAQHATPLRLSLAEPIVLDAYVRTELANAFREDLNRPSLRHPPKALDWLQKKLNLDDRTLERRGKDPNDQENESGAIPWVH
jgi:hypothetical protein